MTIDLEKFFEEKEISYTIFRIEHENFTHIIDTEIVIKYILLTKGHERNKIAGTLFKMDFQNEPIIDYLKFLAQCMIQYNYICKKND